MFSEATTGLIEDALATRDSVRAARKDATSKTAARVEAQTEEQAAGAVLTSATAEHTRTTQAALKAIADELAGKDEEPTTAQARPATRPAPTQRPPAFVR